MSKRGCFIVDAVWFPAGLIEFKKEIGHRSPFFLNAICMADSAVAVVFYCAVVLNVANSTMAAVFYSAIAFYITNR